MLERVFYNVIEIKNNNGQGVRAVAFIRTNGDFDSDTNSHGGISDIKLRENIVDANSQ